MLNLLKLKRGAALYGPLEDCNSYSYSPLLELIHHTLLAPLGASLSLPTNRSLSLLWQGVTVAVLAWALCSGRDLGPKRWPLGVGILAGLWLVVTSSFLTSTLHPDHLTMLAFSLAIALVVAERRMPPWLLRAGLLSVPVFATMTKLTGAGIGLGLVVAFLWPFRGGPLLWLAASAVLALGSIALYDTTLGPFSTYAIGLQASHPIRWGAWHTVWGTAPGRWFLVAIGAAAAARLATRGRASAEDAARVRDAIRLVGLTSAFMLPSLVAYLKVGGRTNSLLPMTIGAAAVLLQLAPLVPSALRSLALAPCALCMLWGVAPPSPVASLADRRAVVARHRQTVSLVKQELDRGRRTLALGDVAAWIDAGGASVPLDSWQTVGELEVGKHEQAEAFFRRIRDGYYQSLVMSRHVLSAQYSETAPRLRQLLKTHFVLVSPQSMPPEDEVVPLLFRRR